MYLAAQLLSSEGDYVVHIRPPSLPAVEGAWTTIKAVLAISPNVLPIHELVATICSHPRRVQHRPDLGDRPASYVGSKVAGSPRSHGLGGYDEDLCDRVASTARKPR
jgi:hypothetical protein